MKTIHINVKSYTDMTTLIYAIIFFIVGALLFTNPNEVIKTVSYLFGVLFILFGVIKLAQYYTMKKKDLVPSQSMIMMGVLAIIIGIITMLCSSAIETSIRFIMGAWILFSGINRLLLAINLIQEKSTNYLSILIIALLMIGCALYMILKSNLVISVIGIFIMIYAITEIIGYISYQIKKKK